LAPVTSHESRVTAFVALGSNLDDPVAQVRSALLSVAALRETRLARTSSLYRNPPVGFLDQPEFVNAVAMVETGLGPRELLAELLGIESAHGRARAVPNGPRTLDLDLALYGDRVIREPHLIVPHPRLAERAFVLVPLLEIAPDAVVPGVGRVADLVKAVDASCMVRIPGG
jgi:2-amino-4-hydroxy-6-hydroxymethyldihydropteridine diphosphokinase